MMKGNLRFFLQHEWGFVWGCYGLELCGGLPYCFVYGFVELLCDVGEVGPYFHALFVVEVSQDFFVGG